MRIANMLGGVLLLVFAVLQRNDPDPVLWIFVYGVGAFWLLLAAATPRALTMKPLTMMLSMTVAGVLLGMMYFWPDTPGWWRTDVWWETERVREGMGMMVVAALLVLPIVTSIRAGGERRREERRAKEELIERRRRSELAAQRALDA